jgi:hypothetical protein
VLPLFLLQAVSPEKTASTDPRSNREGEWKRLARNGNMILWEAEWLQRIFDETTSTF